MTMSAPLTRPPREGAFEVLAGVKVVENRPPMGPGPFSPDECWPITAPSGPCSSART